MKRACPYDANLLRMPKVHLMDHDVDVLALQKVHDNTLKLLMDGARLSGTNTSNDCKPLAMTSYTKTKPSKQLELTHFFKFSAPTPVFQFSAKPSSPKMVSDNVSCYYCDKIDVTNTCTNCREHFCNSCSMKRYFGAEEMYICLTCL